MSCMEINSPDSSGMKGIALMVKNIDGPPIRKGILKAGMGLKENSLINELQVADANLKDEKQGSKERGTDDAVIVQEKVTNGSYADRLKEAANTKFADEKEVIADPSTSKASASTCLDIRNSFEVLNSNSDDGCVSMTNKPRDVRVESLSDEDDVEEKAIELDPMNEELRVREKSYITLLQDTSMDEERFLKQKSKVNWLAAGDANTSFFHMTLKCKNHNSCVEMVRDRNDLMHEGSDVPKAFLKHYEDFLGINA
ncbi:hypothetical protein QVD17_30482 [Tagetes erecta]|uniref:RNA-directed DNA polymerase, eukaryota, reverse transcriptase zinc-binding domain protein n=1 Tax=Tagetes erecta TaxID=13708 RepID=A0AAD8K5E4_TARER|nr:hypothetical protein QVD17_30482 [Tagetes erecta]